MSSTGDRRPVRGHCKGEGAMFFYFRSGAFLMIGLPTREWGLGVRHRPGEHQVGL